METAALVEEEVAEVVGEEERIMVMAVEVQNLEHNHRPPAECHVQLEQPKTSMFKTLSSSTTTGTCVLAADSTFPSGTPEKRAQRNATAQVTKNCAIMQTTSSTRQPDTMSGWQKWEDTAPNQCQRDQKLEITF